MENKSKTWTKPTTDQVRLIRCLTNAVDSLRLPPNWIDTAKIALLDDGGMGSFLIRFESPPNKTNSPYRIVSELTFNDSDGTPVLASLFIDNVGSSSEVDLWKVDFSPLISVPDNLPNATPV